MQNVSKTNERESILVNRVNISQQYSLIHCGFSIILNLCFGRTNCYVDGILNHSYNSPGEQFSF